MYKIVTNSGFFWVNYVKKSQDMCCFIFLKPISLDSVINLAPETAKMFTGQATLLKNFSNAKIFARAWRWPNGTLRGAGVKLGNRRVKRIPPSFLATSKTPIMILIISWTYYLANFFWVKQNLKKWPKLTPNIESTSLKRL